MRFGSLDEPDGVRKMHMVAVPNTGGIAVALAIATTVILSWLYVDQLPDWVTLPSKYFWVGAIILVLAGVYDDRFGLKATTKLAIQIGCAALAWYMGYRIYLDVGPLADLPFLVREFLSVVLTVGWITTIINAVNLIDGLDGLASGVSIIAIVFLSILAVSTGSGQVTGLLLFIYVGCALLGFLLYNKFPATVFLGDTGSMFIGYILGVIALAGVDPESSVQSLIPAVLILGLPIAEVLSTVFRRVRMGIPVFWSDSDHIHHRLEKRFSHPAAVYILYTAAVFFGLAGWLWSLFPQWRLALILIILPGTFFCIRWLGYWKQPAAGSEV